MDTMRTKLISVPLTNTTVALLSVPKETNKLPHAFDYSLKVLSASTWEDSGGVMPAESAEVHGKDAVLALMGLLLENVKDHAGFDYTLQRLAVLCRPGVTIDIKIDVTAFRAVNIEEFGKEAMNLFSGAGFNITHNDMTGGEGPIVTITAEPMSGVE